MTQVVSAPPQPPAPERMTWDEFLATEFEGKVEWVCGEVIHMSGPSLAHQRLSKRVARLLLAYELSHRGTEVCYETFTMRIAPGKPGRAPDILVVLPEHADRFRGNYLEGPADVVVEITSPSTINLDRGEKYLEYEAGGVPEYWLLDPQRRVAEFYRLGARGVYELAPTPGGRFESAVLPGFGVEVESLWGAGVAE
ncbi:MAG: Uma2 family endonuclease [Dehalococcoidia bacterium]|nr:Uma2 family endonuclease [Dehalococcoidia bacterium]